MLDIPDSLSALIVLPADSTTHWTATRTAKVVAIAARRGDPAAAAGGVCPASFANGRASSVTYWFMVCYVAGFRDGGPPTVLDPVFARTLLLVGLAGGRSG
jgi:hypothetical protein